MVQKKCVQCKKTFNLEDSEIEFYKKNELSIPKRCKSCRKKNKRIKYRSNQRQENQSLQERVSSFAVEPVQERVVQPIVEQEEEKSTSRIGRFINRFFKLFSVMLVLFGMGGFLYGQAAEECQTNVDSINLQSKQSDFTYSFRSHQLQTEHFQKHNNDFGYQSESDYVKGANRVIQSEDVMHKREDEDGDTIYYLPSSNEFVILSLDGYIRTYFKPDSGIQYYNKQ